MTCPACGAGIEPGARFCSSCGHQLVVRPDERRVVTVVFADLVGFTARSETADPEHVKALIDRLFDALVADVTAFGGKVDKIVGDAILALFGAPVAHEDDAERAVRAALRMQETLATCTADESVPVQMRIGVNTGEVLVGALRASGDYTAMGDVVNTAQRLQTTAQPGTVVVGPATHAATREVFDFDELGHLHARGREEPVEAWVARRALLPPGHRHRHRGGPLVGRDQELALLGAGLDTALTQPRAELMLIVGEAGVGKSRLAMEVGALGRQCHGATVLEGRCIPYGEANVWWPVAEALRQSCELAPDATHEEAVVRTTAAVATALGLETHDPQVQRVRTGLLHLVGYETPLRGIDPPRAHDEAIRSVVAFVKAAARRAPVVILLWDLHWADPAVLGLVDDLLEAASRAPLVLVATARPELHDRWTPRLGRHNLLLANLDPLSREASTALLRNLVDGELEPVLWDAVIDRSGGNPLYLQELAAVLTERGRTVEGARSGPDGGAAAPVLGDLPDSLRGLIAARIDHLDPSARATLEDAAVWGRAGPTEALHKMCEVQRGDVDVEAVIDQLVEAEILDRSGEGWAFRSDLVREVAYGTLTKGDRAARHFGIAAYLERVCPAPEEAEDRLVDRVAHHYASAATLAEGLGAVPGVRPDVAERAQVWLAEAIRRADLAMVPLVARQLCDQALDLLDDAPSPRRVELLLSRARAAADHREGEAAARDLAAARADADALDDDALRARVLLAEGEVAQESGDLTRALDVLQRAVAAFGRLEDARGVAESLRWLGMTLIFGGDHDEAEAAISDALDEFVRLGDRRGEAWAQQNLAWISYVRGSTSEAEERLERSAETFRELGDQGGLAWVLGLLGFVKFHQGDLTEAEQLAELILVEANRRGDRWAEGMMLMLTAGVRLWTGRSAEATPAGARALELFRSIGDHFGEAQALAGYARALAASGRVVAALALIDESLVRFPDPGEDETALPMRAGFAGTAVFVGEPERALAALEGLDAGSDPDLLGSGEQMVARGLALLQLGRGTEALAVLEPAAEAFQGEGAFPYGMASLALARAVTGVGDGVDDLVEAVRTSPRATYLDRAEAALALAVQTARHGGDAAAVLDPALAALAATDDRLTRVLLGLARDHLRDVVGIGADDERGELEAELAALGVSLRGWRTILDSVCPAGEPGSDRTALPPSTPAPSPAGS